MDERSGGSYPKMLNLFQFDAETKGRLAEFSSQAFDYLQDCPWVATEKVDGTNIRVIVGPDGAVEVRGRSDRAELPSGLREAVLRDTAGLHLADVTLYGEGYGAGIQSGGWYRPDKGFILFDVLQHGDGGGYFLPWDEVEAVAAGCKIPLVPVVSRNCSLSYAHALVQRGLHSMLGDGWAEGLVCRPAVPVRGTRGERLIVKVKHRDYYQKELIPSRGKTER